MNEPIYDLKYDAQTYDIDGLIRMADSTLAAFEFMLSDEDRAYRNRYEILACDRGIEVMLQQIHTYLEQDDTQSLFISFAVSYEGRLMVLNNKQERKLDIGEAELGENIIYGVLIHLEDEEYVFDEVLYSDGGLKDQSWAERIDDAGDLTVLLRNFIEQFI